jgi:hypothetical protein
MVNAFQVLDCCRELPAQRHNITFQKTWTYEQHRYENLKFQTTTYSVNAKFFTHRTSKDSHRRHVYSYLRPNGIYSDMQVWWPACITDRTFLAPLPWNRRPRIITYLHSRPVVRLKPLFRVRLPSQMELFSYHRLWVHRHLLISR